MKKLILLALIGITVFAGCSDNTGSAPGEDERPKEYFYRIDVPAGFSADVIYFYHENPDSIRKSTDLLKGIQGSWETDTYSVNPLSQTPFAELRIDRTRKNNYSDDISGQLTAQIIVDGVAVKDTAWQLPAGLGSIGLGYDLSYN